MIAEGILRYETIKNCAINYEVFWDIFKRLLRKLEEENLEQTRLFIDDTSVHRLRDIRELVEQASHTAT